MFDNTRLLDLIDTVIFPAIFDTLWMLFFSFIFSVIFGIILGCILYITNKNGLKPNKTIYKILGGISDIIRAFPTMILIVSLTPLTRIIFGSSIGIWPAIFAITVGSTPFAARMTETAFQGVNKDLVKWAISAGATEFQIIRKILLVDALPTLVDSFTIMLINMLNMTAMAGAVGAGGLGAIALTYGYQTFDYGVLAFIIVLLIIIVTILQQTGKNIRNRIE